MNKRYNLQINKKNISKEQNKNVKIKNKIIIGIYIYIYQKEKINQLNTCAPSPKSINNKKVENTDSEITNIKTVNPIIKNEVENKFISTKLIVMGETGNGKSSLGNFILGKQAFPVSDKSTTETKITKGHHGINKNKDIFVIDTPGLCDTRNEDREHLIQMVDYIKKHHSLQAIIITLNIHQPRLSSYICSLIKLICNIFPSSNIWEHVALVFTKCYYYLPSEIKQKQMKTVKEEIIPKFLEIIKETNGNNSINSFPTFFIDSDFVKRDPSSIEEVDRLIAWAHSLMPIDANDVKAIDPKIKETIKEKDIKKSKTVKGNIENIKLKYYTRFKYIHYDGSTSFSEWIKYKVEKKSIVYPKKIIKEEIERKEEKSETAIPIYNDDRNSFEETVWPLRAVGLVSGIIGGLFDSKRNHPTIVGYNKTIVIDYYERINKFFNDGSVEHGPWKKVNTKTTTTKI